MPSHRPEKSANLPTYSVTQPEAAHLLNVSDRTLRTVKAIERDAPDMLPKLERDCISEYDAV